jgi:hypothetical protein
MLSLWLIISTIKLFRTFTVFQARVEHSQQVIPIIFNPEEYKMKKRTFSHLAKSLGFISILAISGCGGGGNNQTISSFIDDSSNPYEMHFISDTKAYMLRYGSPSIWIVDPSVTASDEANFKIGEINLGAYDSDGIPEMSSGIVVNDKLYVVMQAMDANYVPGDAYMAVIDTATDTEINVDDNPKNGFALSIKNPVDIDAQGDFIYVTGLGRYGSGAREPEYTGGIERISTIDYSSTLLVDDGDATTHPYGLLNGLVIVSDTQAYFSGYEAWQSVSLYEFDLSTGTVNAGPVSGYDSVNITTSELSPEGYLWIGMGSYSDPLINIIDPSDNSLVDSISLDKNPTQILFNSTTAAIVGVASDYGSSDISLADAASPYSIDKGYAAQDLSDIVAAINEESFFRLGRSSQHNVSKFDITSPLILEWQFSTNPN